MTLPTPKFDTGDNVFWATTTSDKKMVPCPDCNDTKKWLATSPNGTECECECPRCCDSYYNRRNDLTIYSYAPDVQSFIVGAVRIDTSGIYEDAVTYMNSPSGSGIVYGESRCFTTPEEALFCATLLAAERTENTPRCKASAEHVRKFAPYKFTDAKIEEAEKARRGMGVRISMLVDEFRDTLEFATDLSSLKDDLGRVIERWEES